MAMIPMTEARLREAMRDPRYWQQGNPERTDYNAWVTQGWRALVETPADQKADGVVQVQAYERRGPDGTMVQVQAHQRGAPPARAWEAQPHVAWRMQIAREESNREGGDFGYGVQGSRATGALGRYQPTLVAMVDGGWRTADGGWTRRAEAAGVGSEAQFLTNPAAQERALNDVLRRNEEQMEANGARSFIGQSISGLRGDVFPVTAGGLAAAAHREGPRAVRSYLEHRSANRPAPESVRGRGQLSVFNQIEARLRNFADMPYEWGAR